MEGCHVIIFISQNRNPNFPQTLAATINLHGSRRRFRPPSGFTHQQLNLAPPRRATTITIFHLRTPPEPSTSHHQHHHISSFTLQTPPPHLNLAGLHTPCNHDEAVAATPPSSFTPAPARLVPAAPFKPRQPRQSQLHHHLWTGTTSEHHERECENPFQ